MSENTHYLRKVRPSPKYDVIFSVVNPQPEIINFQWDNKHYIESKYSKKLFSTFFLFFFVIIATILLLIFQGIFDHFFKNCCY